MGEIKIIKAPSIIANESNGGKGGGNSTLEKICVDRNFYIRLRDQLIGVKREIMKYSDKFSIIYYPVSIKYNKLIGKSHRIKRLFTKSDDPKFVESRQINSFYSYSDSGELQDKLELVYAINIDEASQAIENLNKILKLLDEDDALDLINKINEIKTSNIFSTAEKKRKKTEDEINGFFSSHELRYINRTEFKSITQDCIFIDSISLLNKTIGSKEQEDSFVRLTKTSNNIKDVFNVLKEIGVDLPEESVISEDDFAVNLDKVSFKKIQSEMPFMISAATNNSFTIEDDEIKHNHEKSDDYAVDEIRNAYLLSQKEILAKPQIGVIDTYCKEFDNLNELIDINNDGSVKNRDYCHGTEVSYLIAANDVINKDNAFKDGLGLFRVKHFGILEGNGSTVQASVLISKVEKIIKNNYKTIKIWNLSIWDKLYKNSSVNISEIGRQFDRIQNKYKILFIISSGNGGIVSTGADSLFSLTVGSVCKNEEGLNEIANYSNKPKKVNGLFLKPNLYDFSNSGDDVLINESLLLHSIDESGSRTCLDISGTSFSAPRVSRKAGYLMYKYGFDINEVKAFINLEAEILRKSGKIKPISLNPAENNAKIILHGNGEIRPGKNGKIAIKLPYSLSGERIYADYVACIGVSYLSETRPSVGVEYSSTEIGLKLKAGTVEQGKEKITSVQDVEGLRGNDKNTIIEEVKLLKKYDPNKAVLDQRFVKNFDNILNGQKFKMTKPLHSKKKLNSEKKYDIDDTYIEVKCIDLFGDMEESKSKLIKYGYVIELFEVSKDSLKSFEQENDFAHIQERIEEKMM